MTRLPPINLDPIILASRVAKALGQFHSFAYAQIDADFTIVQHSPNFLALLEHADWQVVGKSIFEFLYEFVGAEALLEEVLNGEEPSFVLEYVNRIQPDESVIYLNFQVTPLSEHQPNRGLLLVVEDVTEYGRLHQELTQDKNELLILQRQLAKTNQELNRLNQLKSLFLSMSAHDLRSPLSVINGYTELMKRIIPDDDPSNLRRYLATIETQAKRIDRLVNDLLDIDSVENGGIELTLAEYDLVQIVREVVEVEKVNFDRDNIDLRLPHTPIKMRVDKEKIARIIHNLVTNACKYSAHDKKVTVIVAYTEDQALLQVTDNGRGMSSNQIDKLFQPYYRTDDAKESKVEGRGLGLYIVKLLTEAHQGYVEVESTVDIGSTFTVRLPISTNSP